MRQLSPYAVISYIRKKIGYDNYINSYCIDHTILQHEIQEILFEFECI